MDKVCATRPGARRELFPRRTLAGWAALGVSCLFVTASHLSAQEPATEAPAWSQQAFAPAEAIAADLPMALEQVEADDRDVVMLLHAFSFDISEDGRIEATTRQVYWLGTDEVHNDWTTIRAAWSPHHQQPPEFRARTLVLEGADPASSSATEFWLDSSTSSERPAQSSGDDLFSDRRITEAPLPGTRAGVVVETLTTVRETQPFFEEGRVVTLGNESWYPLLEMRIEVQHPSSIPLRISAQGDDVEVSSSTGEDGLQILRVQLPPHLEGNAARLLRPFDQTAAPSFSFSTGTSWNAVATYYADLVDRAIADRGTAAALAAAPELNGSAAEKAQQALDWVHDRVRYTGLELGAASLVPYLPAETLERGYGDCKDQATLLTALLRRADVEAHVALLDTGYDPEAPQTLPGLGQMDHAIVAIEAGDGTWLWVDPTSSTTPANEVAGSNQGRSALIARSETTEMTAIPVAASATNLLRIERQITLPDYGEGILAEVTHYSGIPAQRVRGNWVDMTNEEAREVLATYATDDLLGDLTKVEARNAGRATRPFQLEVVVDSSQYAVTDLIQAIAILDLAPLFAELPADLIALANPENAALEEPGDSLLSFGPRVELTYRIEPPLGMALRELPEAEELQEDAVRFASRFEQLDKGGVLARFELEFPKRRLTADDRRAIANLFEEIDQRSSPTVWFDEPGYAANLQGDGRASVAAYQRALEEWPERAIVHTRQAKALATNGLRDAALQAADRAIALQPDLAVAHFMRAMILQQGDDGRSFSDGFDLGASREAYERALELAPDDDEILAQAGVTYNYGDSGTLLTRGADWERAVELQEKFLERSGETTYLGNLIIGLTRLGRYDEARQFLERYPGNDALARFDLVVQVLQDGAEKGLRRARSQHRDRSQRARVLGGAMFELINMERYDLAHRVAEDLVQLREGPAVAPLMPALLAISQEATATPADPRAAQALRMLEWVSDLMAASLRGEDDATIIERMSERLLPIADPVLVRLLFESEEDGLGDSFGVSGIDSSFLLNPGLLRLFPLLHEIEIRDLGGGLWIADLSSLGSSSGAILGSGGTVDPRIIAMAPDLLGLPLHSKLDDGDENAVTLLLDGVAARIPANATPAERLVLERLWQPARTATGAGSDPPPTRAATEALLLLDGLPDGTGELTRLLPELDPTLQTVLLNTATGLSVDRLSEADLTALLDAATGMPAEAAASARYVALVRARDFEAVDRLLEESTALTGRQKRELRANSQLARGDFEEGIESYRALVREGAQGNAWNQLAWAQLYLDELPEDALDNARRATEGELASYGSLHTQAAVEAFADLPFDAFQTLSQAIAQGGGESQPHDFLVLGRIAETWQLPEAAAELYERCLVDGDGQDDPSSSEYLCSRRLAGLR